MKFYIVDYGKDMIEQGKLLTDYLESKGFHHIAYLTNSDGLLCCEEITENEFLDHFKNTNRNA